MEVNYTYAFEHLLVFWTIAQKKEISTLYRFYSGSNGRSPRKTVSSRPGCLNHNLISEERAYLKYDNCRYICAICGQFSSPPPLTHVHTEIEIFFIIPSLSSKCFSIAASLSAPITSAAIHVFINIQH